MSFLCLDYTVFFLANNSISLPGLNETKHNNTFQPYFLHFPPLESLQWRKKGGCKWSDYRERYDEEPAVKLEEWAEYWCFSSEKWKEINQTVCVVFSCQRCSLFSWQSFCRLHFDSPGLFLMWHVWTRRAQALSWCSPHERTSSSQNVTRAGFPAITHGSCLKEASA